MIEVGREGDISVRGLVGRTELDSAEAVEAQCFLAKVADVVTKYSLRSDTKLNWRYRILADPDGPSVGVLTPKLNKDLWKILNRQNKGKSHRPPSRLNYVRGQGCSTLVLASDDNDLSVLHEPWASTGFLLAPRIAAFPSFNFGRR